MQYHTLPIPISAGHKTQGFFALNGPKNLVVFVHGFLGSAIDTWCNFQEYIIDTDKFKETDVVFYGYKSLRMQTNNQALILMDFLNKIQQPVTNGFIPASFPERNYEKIVFVAHSLGSIIVRRALLNANQQNEDWLNKIRMVLFAPAHNGARAAALAKEAGGLILGVAAYIARYKYPVLDELDIGSPTITNLRNDTEKLLQTGKGNFAKAHTVVWAELEKVVDNQPFCLDPLPKLIQAKGHMEVCKPFSQNFNAPVDYVLKALL